MSKYNLMELLNEYVGGSRHGTLNITFKDLESEMNEVGNIGDFVVRKKSNVSDKVNHEFEIIPIGNVTGKGEEKGGIRIYDYKFGFNPAEELTDKEHSFSVGGDDKGDTLSLLKFLFPKRARGYFEKNISNIDPDAWSESPSYGKLGTEIDEEMSDKDKDFEKAKEADRLENHPERDKIKAIQALLAKERGMNEELSPEDHVKIVRAMLVKAEKDGDDDLKRRALADMESVKKYYNLKEDLLSKDGDNEDNVDNIDKVASPSAKGTGYKAAVDSERSESSKEQSDITQTTKPMYEDMSLMSLAKKLGIDVKDLKDRVSKMQSKEKDEIEASARASMAEARIDRDVAERIEGMLDISMKKKFMESFMDLYSDLLEEDNFFPEDIINHLNNEMYKELDGYQRQGDKLAGIGENGHVSDYAEEIKEASAEESIADYIIDYYTNPKTGEKIIDDDIVMAYFKTHPDYMDRFDGTPEGMKDGLDDFQEFLLVNYDIPSAGEMDEAKKMEDLKEQFKRFR